MRIRRAAAADGAPVSAIFLDAFEATYEFPLARTDEEVRGWIADHVIAELETWVAEDASGVVGFVALSASMVEQLYVKPGRTGAGIGSALLGRAKLQRPLGLALWTFQVNRGARRFYSRQGFEEVEWGDGAGNEEGQPDVRLAWRPAP